MDAREDRPLSARPLARIAVAALLAAAAASPASALGERPALADDIEKRFADRFLLATNGGGTYTIYQRIEADLGVAREVVCLMQGECFVALGEVPEGALQAASREPPFRRRVTALFGAARDDYARLLATPREARPAAEAAWLERAARIAPCLTERRCGEE